VRNAIAAAKTGAPAPATEAAAAAPASAHAVADDTAGVSQAPDGGGLSSENEFSDSEWDEARAGDFLSVSRDSYARRRRAATADFGDHAEETAERTQQKEGKASDRVSRLEPPPSSKSTAAAAVAAAAAAAAATVVGHRQPRAASDQQLHRAAVPQPASSNTGALAGADRMNTPPSSLASIAEPAAPELELEVECDSSASDTSTVVSEQTDSEEEQGGEEEGGELVCSPEQQLSPRTEPAAHVLRLQDHIVVASAERQPEPSSLIEPIEPIEPIEAGVEGIERSLGVTSAPDRPVPADLTAPLTEPTRCTELHAAAAVVTDDVNRAPLMEPMEEVRVRDSHSSDLSIVLAMLRNSWSHNVRGWI
jgi:hypothetical protein